MKAGIIMSAINVFLGTMVAVIIWYGEISFPEISSDELANYNSWMSKINEGRIEEAASEVNRAQKNAGQSRSPKVIRALVDLKTSFEFLQANHELFNEAAVNSADKKVWQSTVLEALHISDSVLGESMEKYVSAIRAQFIKMTERDLPGDLLKTFTNQIESDLIYLYIKQMDEFQMESGASSVIFDDFSISPKPSISSQWTSGTISFNTPERMKLGEKVRVLVKVGKGAQQQLLESAMSGDSVSADSLMVGDIMIVKLIGEAFNITAHDDEEQGVMDEGYTQWEFDVTAKEDGVHELYVKAGIVYNVPSLGNTRKFFPSYERKITIEVSALDQASGFISNHWEFLVSTFFIPGCIWTYSRFRKRRSVLPQSIEE
jgi:hypothetical protein